MARHRRAFRTNVYPFLENWSGGPGYPIPIVRFGVLLSWQPRVPPDPDTQPRHFVEALLAPEIPYSVLPASQARAYDVELRPPGENWRGRSVPRWQGALCLLHETSVWLPHADPPHDLFDFSLLVLLPEANPTRPPLKYALLGQEFLRHYGWQLVQDYDAIRFITPEGMDTSQLDRAAVCGRLELP